MNVSSVSVNIKSIRSIDIFYIKTKYWIRIIFGLLLIFFPEVRAQEEQQIIAKGTGIIVAGDQEKAVEEAFADALSNALEHIVGELLSPRIELKQKSLLKRRIYVWKTKYFKSYQVLKHSRRKPNILEISVSVVIDKPLLLKELRRIGLGGARIEKPSVLVVLHEREIPTDGPYKPNRSEIEMQKILRKKNFQMVPSQNIDSKVVQNIIQASMKKDYQKIQWFGRQVQADLVIFGEAAVGLAKRVPLMVRENRMVACQALLNLKVIRTIDGKIIAVHSKRSHANHINFVGGSREALKKVVKKSLKKLIPLISKEWQKSIDPEKMIHLKFLGFLSNADLLRLKRIFEENVKGVNAVYYQDHTDEFALLRIHLSGNRKSFIESMTVSNFSPFQFNIIYVSRNLVVIQFISQ